MSEPKFEYYVLNYNCNAKQIEKFNIFRNGRVYEWTLKAVKKYVASPRNFKYVEQYKNPYLGHEEIAIYGFEAFCREIRSILMNQLWSRREYEISVSDAFVAEICDIVKDLDTVTDVELRQGLINTNKRNPRLEKWDCFDQCEDNIPVIAREVIYQYKEWKKNERTR